MENNNFSLPTGWDRTAQLCWINGQKTDAINAVLSVINRHADIKPLPLVFQLSYYLFLVDDPASGAKVLESSRAHHPKDVQLLMNLGVCLSRAGNHHQAIFRVRELLEIAPENAMALGTLASSLSSVGDYDAARAAGTKTLLTKDSQNTAKTGNWKLPSTLPSRWISNPTKKNVISFSLWGSNPRYLRGAIDNVLAGPVVYPGWVLRFYVDDSVPIEVRDTLESLGAKIVVEPPNQGLRNRLAWRFKVANDIHVGRFLVRDVDSVINARESWAVSEWIASEKWCHVMRDWWTHTDLMLAGMWGGIAGTLPNMTEMLASFAPNVMETPNIDQLFLAKRVWQYVRKSCLIHDRFFSPPGTVPWAIPDPAGSIHVGQDVFSAHRASQEKRLADWINKLPSLQVAPR